jgi:hypothetical protein
MDANNNPDMLHGNHFIIIQSLYLLFLLPLGYYRLKDLEAIGLNSTKSHLPPLPEHLVYLSSLLTRKYYNGLGRWFLGVVVCSFLLFSGLKLKLSHYTPWWCLRERTYSSYSFSTSALDGGQWSTSCPGHASALGKEPPVPTVQEVGWAAEPVWTQRLEQKSFCLCQGSNLNHPVIQPVLIPYWLSYLDHYLVGWQRISNTGY